MTHSFFPWALATVFPAQTSGATAIPRGHGKLLALILWRVTCCWTAGRQGGYLFIFYLFCYFLLILLFFSYGRSTKTGLKWWAITKPSLFSTDSVFPLWLHFLSSLHPNQTKSATQKRKQPCQSMYHQTFFV